MLAAQLHGAVPSAHPARITLLSAITFDASVQRCVCVSQRGWRHPWAVFTPGLCSQCSRFISHDFSRGYQGIQDFSGCMNIAMFRVISDYKRSLKRLEGGVWEAGTYEVMRVHLLVLQ